MVLTECALPRKESSVPEIPLCIYCRKSIDRDIEDYVVTNKGEVADESDWLYAHRDCHDEAVSKETP
jgi:hypothetical protein